MTRGMDRPFEWTALKGTERHLDLVDHRLVLERRAVPERLAWGRPAQQSTAVMLQQPRSDVTHSVMISERYREIQQVLHLKCEENCRAVAGNVSHG